MNIKSHYLFAGYLRWKTVGWIYFTYLGVVEICGCVLTTNLTPVSKGIFGLGYAYPYPSKLLSADRSDISGRHVTTCSTTNKIKSDF